MKARLSALLGLAAQELWVQTFHAFGARFLRREAARAGLPPAFAIYDTDDQLRLMKRLFAEARLDEEDQLTPRKVLWRIDALEERGHHPLAGEGRRTTTWPARRRATSTRSTRRRWPGPAPSTSATCWSARCGCWRRTRRCGPAGPAASATCWWTSSRTPTRCSTGCCATWWAAPGTSAWWATTTRPSTAGAAPTCATSSASTATSPAAGWSSWSGTTAPPATSSTPPTPSSPGPGCGGRRSSGPRPGRAIRWRCWSGRTSTTRRSGSPAPWWRSGRAAPTATRSPCSTGPTPSPAPSRPQLRAARIPYVIVRGTSFYDRAEVKDAAAYLRLALSPAERPRPRADRQPAAARHRREDGGAAAGTRGGAWRLALRGPGRRGADRGGQAAGAPGPGRAARRHRRAGRHGGRAGRRRRRGGDAAALRAAGPARGRADRRGGGAAREPGGAGGRGARVRRAAGRAAALRTIPTSRSRRRRWPASSSRSPCSARPTPRRRRGGWR